MKYFVDTFFFLALLNKDEQEHESAVQLSRTISGERITTFWVLVEVADALRKIGNRPYGARFIRFILNAAQYRVIGDSEAYFRKGLELYEKRPDKEWSLTDCTSFVVMEELGLTKVLTADKHFEQASFQAVLKK